MTENAAKAAVKADVSVKPQSAWSPFGEKAFLLLWFATLISNIGTWMHDVGAGWLMTTLDPSPATVSLVQAATTAPVFLFVVFAGALADRLDKRWLLLVTNLLLFFIISAMSVLVFTNLITPLLLVVFTFAIGTVTAFMAPAWQAIVPQLVPREKLNNAIALNSMGINISRAIGPAIGGFLIASVSIAAPFALNAVSCLVILLAVFIWKPPAKPKTDLPPEPYLGSILTGFRHASRNTYLKQTLLRSFGFFLFASAYWAMLPLVAKDAQGGGATLYGLMLTCIGTGAVTGALLLPKFKEKLPPNMRSIVATIMTAGAMITLALVKLPAAILAASFLGGFSWILMLTGLNVSLQTSLPNWVRARGLSLGLMVFSGCMAIGSIIWGQVATYSSVEMALMASAGLMLFFLIFLARVPLGQSEDSDLTPAMSWDAPVVAEDFDASFDRGPVMILIDYRIDPKTEKDFLMKLHLLSGERYRDGAYDWGVFQDSESSDKWTEWFMLSSWAEHLRQHERHTREDEDVHSAVKAFHVGKSKPVVRHLLAPKGKIKS